MGPDLYQTSSIALGIITMSEGRNSFRIITFGCKVNQYESAYIVESLARAGCREAPKDEKADITIINTCIVTQRASYQSRQAIRKAIRENPGGVVAAVGCYGQAFPEELSRINGIQLIAGNTSKGQLPEILFPTSPRPSSPGGEGGVDDTPLIISKGFESHIPFECVPIKRFPNRTRAFLKIQDGCQSFCSYCIVPYARGPLRSLDPSKVVAMLRSFSETGYKEVVLTGIHLGKYGFDFNNGTDLKGLLRQIGKQGLPLRIRLSSLEPNEIDRELIEMVATEPWLCRHFHIPLQSGDNAILKKMNRTYTAGEFKSLIELIHKRIPLAAIGVDVMAGFPGEDDRAYQNTFVLIRGLPVSYLHVFPFSPREGTAAARFPGQVNEKVVKSRTAELRHMGQKKKTVFHESCIGKGFLVLAEGWESEERKMVKGLSDNYLKVLFPSQELIKNELRLLVMEKGVGMGIIGRPQEQP
ncbi:MAG: tRNA (N(6)-L-threonylcarbamoyladenosine(37)-C(2))-methylthiotransferase MtaB [Pseudomonadota bacterium]